MPFWASHSGVLHQELFFQSGRELLLCWERVRDIAPQVRAQTRNPIEWKNLELAAGAYVKWWKSKAPDAHEAFVKRIRG